MTDELKLQTIFRRENRSFLQYVRESSMWANPHDHATRDEILKLGLEDYDAITEFAKFLQSQRIPLPYLGAYNTTFTSYNYVTARSLVPMLVREFRKELEQLTTDVGSLANLEARSAVERVKEQKEKHLRSLEGLAESFKLPKSA